MDNPLLIPSDAPFGAPRFDLIRKEHYVPAFEEAVRRAKTEIDAIVGNPEPPTFANTVEALEYAGRDLAAVEGIFFNLLEADSDPQMEAIAEQVSPMLTEFSLYVSLNRPLFERVRQVHQAAQETERDRQRLLEETYRSFVRSGAALGEAERGRFGQIREQLDLLELKFGQQTLAATNAFSLLLTEEADLEGLPEYVRESAREAAQEKGQEGWLFTLHAPSYGPFLKFSTRRNLRERMWRAYNSRALDTNAPVIRDIVRLRLELARLLGYGTYADYALEPRMAKTRGTVDRFLDRLMEPSLPVARREVQELSGFARAEGFGEPLMPWDFSFLSERMRRARFDVDEQLLKPYFNLDDTIGAVLGLAGRLYGLSFSERKDIPVYHKDVRVYEVLDEKGEHLALFYADFFPRESKRGGAWMTEFRGQYMQDGKDYRPFISIVTNFSKPAAGKPSLLTHGEVETFLHEFGHSLHGMLSRGRYPSQSGTNVARDFVELPSQIMENWAYEPAWLDTFARHYETGEPLPEEYIRRIVAARNFQAGYAQVRQLQFGLLDMAWHTLTEVPDEDVETFENRVLASCRTLPAVEGTAVCPSFGHIFSGGYSAGYYSYKWAEVLEADAFALFQENGIFDRVTAGRFRKNILERGSSEDESVLYRNFRGHDPQPEALLRKLGIL
ncbi:MAG: M3 family metallopeptidase [Bacteroidales bacterium]|nr:M3 family metallopeptidase [Bacteroidales bacterium]